MSGCDITKARRVRFTVAGLLFVVLCVAGILAGYRFGFERGHTAGVDKRRSEQLFATVYPVGDLVYPPNADPSATAADFDSLVRALRQAVDQETWDEFGGPGTISVVPSNQTIVVNQYELVHEQIENLLQQLRTGAQTTIVYSTTFPDDDVYVEAYNVENLVGQPDGEFHRRLDQLVERVRVDVSPDTWDIAGGLAVVAAFPPRSSLIVSHTPEGHGLVKEYLADLDAAAEHEAEQ